MNEKILGNNRLINFLLLMFPIFIVSLKFLGLLVLFIAVIMGIYIIVKYKISPFKIKALAAWCWVSLIYFVIVLLSIVYSNGLDSSILESGKKLNFLLVPLLAITIYNLNLPLSKVLLSIKIALMLMGLIVIYQYYVQQNPRPSADLNANIFSDIAVLFFFLSITKIVEEKTTTKIISFIGLFFGFYAIIISQSRWSWFLFILLFCIYSYLMIAHYNFSVVKNILLSILILTNTIFIVSYDIIDKNLSKTIVKADVKDSSIGSRIAMWKSGIKIIKEETPLFGYGYRNANKEAQRHTAINISGYSHLHNEYITTLVYAGVIGFMFLLALLFFPLYIFIKNYKSKAFHYCLMGIITCMAYVLIGFTHTAFDEEHISSVYIFLISLLLPTVIAKNNVATKTLQ